MWLFNLLFSSLSQLWYVEVRISGSVSVSPLKFEIMGVDCILMWMLPLYLHNIKKSDDDDDDDDDDDGDDDDRKFHLQKLKIFR